jgi:hypothetical protein
MTGGVESTYVRRFSLRKENPDFFCRQENWSGGIPYLFLRNLSRQSAGGHTSGGMIENHAFAASPSTISR